MDNSLLTVTEYTSNGHGCIAIAQNRETILDFLRKRVAKEVHHEHPELPESEIANRLSLEWDVDVICVRWPAEAIVVVRLESPHVFQQFTVEKPQVLLSQGTNEELCICCGKPATWMRHTQFLGDHPFCTEDAEKEEDFGKTDPSQFVWEELKTSG